MEEFERKEEKKGYIVENTENLEEKKEEVTEASREVSERQDLDCLLYTSPSPRDRS